MVQRHLSKVSNLLCPSPQKCANYFFLFFLFFIHKPDGLRFREEFTRPGLRSSH
uniref:Uncharacterized protein n=1 Tax=Anguilla anguilla TaxID=7936 RepID=A0A0E9QB40_ANGAN